jgi:predicted transcriptional regulator
MSDRGAEAHLSAGGVERSLRDLLNGYQNTAVLYVAAKLGLADLLANGPKTSKELAAMTGAHAPSLYRILRGLVIVGMCFEEEERFGLTRLGEVLRTGVEGSLRNQASSAGSSTWWRGAALPTA